MKTRINICKVCGKRFTPYRTFQVYCSDKCRNEVLGRTRQYKRTNVVTKKCQHCGKEFETNMKHKLYCCNDCYIAERANYYEPVKSRKVKCEICGEEFETTHGAKKYCSHDCYLEAAMRRSNERLK